MNKARKTILSLAVAAFAAAAVMPVSASAKGWEPVKTERADAKTVAQDTELEVKVAKTSIIVTSSKPVQIKLFTILGQLVSSETLPAGTSMFSLPQHGVYIVKVGDITCKVAV